MLKKKFFRQDFCYIGQKLGSTKRKKKHQGRNKGKIKAIIYYFLINLRERSKTLWGNVHGKEKIMFFF